MQTHTHINKHTNTQTHTHTHTHTWTTQPTNKHTSIHDHVPRWSRAPRRAPPSRQHFSHIHTYTYMSIMYTSMIFCTSTGTSFTTTFWTKCSTSTGAARAPAAGGESIWNVFFYYFLRNLEIYKYEHSRFFPILFLFFERLAMSRRPKFLLPTTACPRDSRAAHSYYHLIDRVLDIPARLLVAQRSRLHKTHFLGMMKHAARPMVPPRPIVMTYLICIGWLQACICSVSLRGRHLWCFRYFFCKAVFWVRRHVVCRFLHCWHGYSELAVGFARDFQGGIASFIMFGWVCYFLGNFSLVRTSLMHRILPPRSRFIRPNASISPAHKCGPTFRSSSLRLLMAKCFSKREEIVAPLQHIPANFPCAVTRPSLCRQPCVP